MGLKRSFKLMNELPYTPSTWAEWVIAGSGTTKGVSGIHLVADGANDTVYILTTLKGSTKYGLLYKVPSVTANDNFAMNSQLTGGTVVLGKASGHNKAAITTQAVITTNRLSLFLGASNTDGTYIDLTDFRIYELPLGSQIESDFINLTADQLALMYPFTNGIINSGSMSMHLR